MRLTALALTSLLAMSVPMMAETVYSYTGSDFDFSEVNNVPQNPPGTVAAPYSTSDAVTGSFEIAGNVSNLNDADFFSSDSFSFTDGVQTLNNSNATFFAQISTDASGDITSYVIQVANSSNGVEIIQIGDTGSPAGFGRVELSPTDVVSAETNTVGTFAAPAPTPEPGSLALLGTGMLGVVAEMRRRIRRA